jgi:hypothetical protein
VRDGLLSNDMLSDSDRMLERLDLLVMAGSRNGLRESGRGGGSSNGEAGLVGDTARLRNGLFEGRFNDNPADRWSCCEPAMMGKTMANPMMEVWWFRCWFWREPPFAYQLELSRLALCDRVKMSWIEFL